jgi:putative CocE/NonD family hydrolase
MRFFDRHLLGSGAPDAAPEPRVTWYTQVEGRWKHAATWPPPAEALRLYLSPGRALVEQPPASAGEDRIRIDAKAGTGARSRWRSLMGERGPIEYRDRRARDARLCVYDSAPLVEEIEVTGHPSVVLDLAVAAEDVDVFAYLEDVSPGGDVGYVTEGQLRALHRALLPPQRARAGLAIPQHSFERADARPLVPGTAAELRFALLPTSYLFERGHRVRLALAGADVDHFAPRGTAALEWSLRYGAPGLSHLELPVVRRGRSGLP